MGRPATSPNSERTLWVWSHGDGMGRRVDPANHPPAECLTKADYQPIDVDEFRRVERVWQRLDINHRLK
eukprot:4753404-Pyramimonas_sp.AAC.1